MSLALSIPKPGSHRAKYLQVALKEGDSWNFDADTMAHPELTLRISPLSVELGAGNDWPKARLAFNSAPYSSAGTEYLKAVDLSKFDSLIDPKQRIVIYAGDEAATRSFLFDGYMTVPVTQFTESADEFEILCTSAAESIDEVEEAWIRGRHMRCVDGGTDTYRHVQSMPVVFNQNGKPNCYATPLSLTVNGVAYADVSVFTYEGDPTARYWRWADVFNYLSVFHGIQAANRKAVDFAPVYNRSLYWLQDDGALDPVNLADVDGASWADVMQMECPQFACSGWPLMGKVLPAIERMTSIRCAQVTLNDSDDEGKPDTQIVCWLRGEGGPFRYFGDSDTERIIEAQSSGTRVKPSPRAVALPKSGTALIDADKAECATARLIWDSRNIVSKARRIGDPVRYEVTLGKAGGDDTLKPGWEPDTMFGDNITDSSAIAAKVANIRKAESALGSGDAGTMFDRYDKRGKDFAKYNFVGRLWVLNESGEWSISTAGGAYDGTRYARTNGSNTVWTAARYAKAYDFHTLCGIATPDDGKWPQRRRAIQRLVSRFRDDDDVPNATEKEPIVQCSFDSGSHWYNYPGSVSFHGSADRDEAFCAVILNDANLGKVVNDKAPRTETGYNHSVWEAIVRGTFRLAVTCSINGDEVCQDLSAACSTWRDVTRDEVLMSRTPQLRKYVIANSMLASMDGWYDPEIDDDEKAAALANIYVSSHRNRMVSGTITIPHVTNDWLPGDLCRGLEPRGVSFAATEGGSTRYPEVVKVVVENRGAQQTTITFEDTRLQAKFA